MRKMSKTILVLGIISILLLGLFISCDDDPPKVEPEPEVEKVSAINVDVEELILKVGDTGTITATISPSNATNKNVAWTSDNEEVATVNGSGIVTSVSEGVATITATTNNGKTATTQITVVSADTVAMIDGVEYSSLAEAIETATDSTPVEIVILKTGDTALTTNIKIEGGRN